MEEEAKESDGGEAVDGEEEEERDMFVSSPVDLFRSSSPALHSSTPLGSSEAGEPVPYFFFFLNDISVTFVHITYNVARFFFKKKKIIIIIQIIF